MRNITLKQLRILSEACRTGSFVGAAEAVHLSPPAVTMQIKALEEEVGLPLFDRSEKRLRPTLAGLELHTAAESIARTLADAATAIEAMRGGEGGTVSVGVVSTAKYFAPFALGAFRQAHPAIDLKLTIGNREDIIDRFGRMEFDIAIMGRPPEHLGVEQVEIGDNPHVIVAAPGHRCVGKRRLTATQIAAEPFLMREPGSGTRMLTERLLAEAGAVPNVVMEIGSNETIKQAVMAGLGIALISAHTVATELHDGRLAILDVEGLPIVRKWYVVTLKSKRLLPAARALRDFWVREGRGFLPEI